MTLKEGVCLECNRPILLDEEGLVGVHSRKSGELCLGSGSEPTRIVQVAHPDVPGTVVPSYEPGNPVGVLGSTEPIEI